MIKNAKIAPTISANTYASTFADDKAIGPAENRAPTVTAGLAYEAEGEAMIAAVSHVPTAKGAVSTFPLRIHPNTTIIKPAETISSLNVSDQSPGDAAKDGRTDLKTAFASKAPIIPPAIWEEIYTNVQSSLRWPPSHCSAVISGLK